MSSLKELLKYDNNEMSVIRRYFIENGLIAEATEMLTSLQYHIIKELQWSTSYMRSWAGTQQFQYLFDNYPKDVAELLANFEVYVIANSSEPKFNETMPKVKEVKEVWLEELRKVVPQYKEPKIYFVPALETLKSNGIYFKDKKE